MKSTWNEDSENKSINANEQFRIVSLEKLLEVRNLLDEILKIDKGIKVQEYDEEK